MRKNVEAIYAPYLNKPSKSVLLILMSIFPIYIRFIFLSVTGDVRLVELAAAGNQDNSAAVRARALYSASILRPGDQSSCCFHFAGHIWLVKLCGREVFNSSTSRGFDVKKPVVVPSKRSSEPVVVPSKYDSYEIQM
ncbi:unnamed protein product [Prunus brigantina]